MCRRRIVYEDYNLGNVTSSHLYIGKFLRFLIIIKPLSKNPFILCSTKNNALTITVIVHRRCR